MKLRKHTCTIRHDIQLSRCNRYGQIIKTSCNDYNLTKHPHSTHAHVYSVTVGLYGVKFIAIRPKWGRHLHFNVKYMNSFASKSRDQPHDHSVACLSPTSTNHSVRQGMTSNIFYHHVFIRRPQYSSYIRSPSLLLSTIFIVIRDGNLLAIALFDSEVNDSLRL